MQIHLIQITSDIIPRYLSLSLILFHRLLVNSKLNTNLIPLPIRLEVVLFEHFNIRLPLFLLCTRHFIDDLNDTVDKQNKEKHYHKDTNVGIGHRSRVPRREIPIPNRTDSLKTPVSRIIQPDVPRIMLYDVQIESQTSRRVYPRCTRLRCQPVSTTRIRPPIDIEMVVYSKKDSRKPHHYENDNTL